MSTLPDKPSITTIADTPIRPYYATEFQVLLSQQVTGGKFYLSRAGSLKPADAPPFHRHTREDEIWVVHTGSVRFFIGGDSLATATRHDVTAGTVVYGPRGISHTFLPLEANTDMSIFLSPGAIEDFYTSTEKADERRDFDHRDKFAKFGIDLLDRAPTLDD